MRGVYEALTSGWFLRIDVSKERKLLAFSSLDVMRNADVGNLLR